MNDPYTPIHNKVLEELSKVSLSAYEIRVLFCIWRKTYGFKSDNGERKKEDFISLSQISEMTGIQKPHVSRSIKLLEKRGIVTKKGNNLAFNKKSSSWVKLPKGVNTHHRKKLPKGVTSVTKGGNKSLPKGVTTKEKKETYTKEISTNVDTGFGNPDVNECVEYFKKKMKIPKEEISQKMSRRYWFLLLRESKTGIKGVKWLIDIASQDEFYRYNISSSKALYYKRVTIMKRVTDQKGGVYDARGII